MNNIYLNNSDSEFFLSSSDEKINENVTPKIIFIVPYRDREYKIAFSETHAIYFRRLQY